MYSLNELIVLIWMVPVALNILLPLLVLVIWAAGRGVLMLKPTTNDKREEAEGPAEVRFSPAGS